MGLTAVGENKATAPVARSTPVLRAAEPTLSLGTDSFVRSNPDPLGLGRKGPQMGSGTKKIFLGSLIGVAGAAGVGAWIANALGGGGLLASIAGAVGIASLPAWLPIVSLALLAGGAALAYWGHREQVEEESVRLALPSPPKPAWS
jgi:hypothetical protein